MLNFPTILFILYCKKKTIMNKKSIQKQVLNIIISVFDPQEPINNEMDLRKDLGMDIISKIELVQHCEYEFNIKLTPAEMIELTKGTVGDIVNFIDDFLTPFKHTKQL